MSDEALNTIHKKYADPVHFVDVCINQGLSSISEHANFYIVKSELDISSGLPKSQRDVAKAIMDTVKNVQAEHDGYAPIAVVIEEALKKGLSADTIETMIKRLKMNGTFSEPSQGFLIVE